MPLARALARKYDMCRRIARFRFGSYLFAREKIWRLGCHDCCLPSAAALIRGRLRQPRS